MYSITLHEARGDNRYQDYRMLLCGRWWSIWFSGRSERHANSSRGGVTINCGKFVGELLDLSKAYDSVNRDGLRTRLKTVLPEDQSKEMAMFLAPLIVIAGGDTIKNRPSWSWELLKEVPPPLLVQVLHQRTYKEIETKWETRGW